MATEEDANRITEVRDENGLIIGRNQEPISKDAALAEVRSWERGRQLENIRNAAYNRALTLRDVTQPEAWKTANKDEALRNGLRLVAILALDRLDLYDEALFDEGT